MLSPFPFSLPGSGESRPGERPALHKERMKIIYLAGARRGIETGLEVTADGSSGTTEGRGLRAGSCRMEIGNRLGIDESPVHRGRFYRFIGLVTGAGLLPR